MTTYLRCPRKWYWSYIEGFEAQKYNTNLSVGSAVHAALQAHYRGQDAKSELFLYWAGVPVTEMEVEQQAKDVKLSEIMIDGYLDWIAETAVDAGLQVVAVEEKVEMPLGDFILHGTLDLVMRDEEGGLWLFDHKTTKNFGDLADRRMQLNFQLLTYANLCRHHFGVAPKGATLNMLRKVLRTAASKPPFYQRETVGFNQFQLDNHVSHMLAIVSNLALNEGRIAAGDLTGVYPVVDQDCTWKCPFLSVCALADDGSDIEGALNDLYVRRDKR